MPTGSTSGRSNPWTPFTKADGHSILLLVVVSAAWLARYGASCGRCCIDPSFWLQEISRVAHGELPYRDFLWQHPPLAVMLYGYTLQVFGIRFDVVQILMDLNSLAVVVLSYALLRQLAGTLLATLTGLLLIAVCCTSLTYFSLFSLFGYNPALQTGALGLLLLLNGVLAYVEDGRLNAGRIISIALGTFIAVLSKLEPVVASVGILLTLIAFDPWRGSAARAWLIRSAFLLAICFLPALAVYALLVNAAGFSTLAAALSGYDLGSNACPWWPTGVGMWAALAGIGAAAVLIAIGSAARRTAWRSYLGPSRYTLLWLAALLGLGFYLGYALYAHAPGIFDSGLTGREWWFLAGSMASTTDVFRAALWPAILYWAYLLGRGLRQRGRLPGLELKKLLLLTPLVLMSARGLFGTTLAPLPEVPAICYPFVILLAPYLLYLALSAPGDALTIRAALSFVTTLTILYIAIRIVAGYSEVLSDSHYKQFDTNAGRIKVSDGGTSQAIYNYVAGHTSALDGILELPYGGGIGFASGRRSPVYTTLFVQLSPPESVQRRDVERMSRTPAALVIASDQPRFGTYFGVDLPVGCEFPRIVWKSGKPAGDPNRVLPIVDFISENYQVERRIGGWQVLRLKPTFARPR